MAQSLQEQIRSLPQEQQLRLLLDLWERLLPEVENGTHEEVLQSAETVGLPVDQLDDLRDRLAQLDAGNSLMQPGAEVLARLRREF